MKPYNMKSNALKWMAGVLLSILIIGIFQGTTCRASETIKLDISRTNIVISESGNYIIKGTTDTNTIQVSKGVTARIMLMDVSIYNPGDNRKETDLIDIKSGASVELVVCGRNTIENEFFGGAIHVPQGATLIISEDSTGSIRAIAGFEAAAIGGSAISAEEGCGTIVINGGTVYAESPWDNCGIGGGTCSRGDNYPYQRFYIGGGDITINGGIVTAIGGSDGEMQGGMAGIGGDSLTRQGSITINGGIVKASSCEAGIGSESTIGMGNRITINGGTITANGNNNAAGIGSASNSENTQVFINGGTITAKGDYGTRELYEGYSRDTQEYLDSMRGYDIAAGQIVISGGDIRAYDFSVQPVDTNGDIVKQTFLNCETGKITKIKFDDIVYGTEDMTSDGFISIFLPEKAGKLTVSSGKNMLFNDDYFNTYQDTIDEMPRTKQVIADLGTSDLELIKGGCIYENKVYRCDTILVTGSVINYRIYVHQGKNNTQHLVFQNLNVKYSLTGRSDFLILDNEVSLFLTIQGENTVSLGKDTRGLFVGHDASLIFTGDEEGDVIKFYAKDNADAIYTNYGNVLLYGGCMNFELTNGAAINTGDYGTFSLCGGSFKAHNETGAAITGSNYMKVNVFGGTLLADTIGVYESGNEEISNKTKLTMTGGTVLVNERVIFSELIVYGGNLTTRILGCGTGCDATVYGGILTIGAYLDYVQGEQNSDLLQETIFDGIVIQQNDVPMEELAQYFTDLC